MIVEAEKTLPNRHLISQNIANNKARVENPHPAVSIFNFHYAQPPETVAMNYGLNKVIGDNETGFRGTNDLPYRVEAWEFLLAGGGLFNNLDYSFTAGREDGTFVYPANQPGGGNPAFRKQIRVLRDFIHHFDFVKMRPLNAGLSSHVANGAVARVLAQPGRAYAVYLGPELRSKGSPNTGGKDAGQGAVVVIELPAGRYRAEWIDPLTGKISGRETVAHKGGGLALRSPPYREDIALRLVRR
jgi:hypothetical protein